MATYTVWYMRPEFSRDGMMGYDWLAKRGLMVYPESLDKTHIKLKQVEAEDLEGVFYAMQGEIWSPKGEARELIKRKGLQHTSMSVGDVAVRDEDGAAFIVDRFGFKELQPDDLAFPAFLDRRKVADKIDGYDRDDLGESPDY